jgi:thioredoxin-like negative regulator of GroEL
MHFLDNSHFEVGQGGELTVAMKGYALVLFYSSQCEHCGEMMEKFSELNDTVNGCSFAQVNLDNNKPLIAKVNKSNVKLEYVPFVVLFANSSPYMIYSGPVATPDLRRFILEVTNAYAKEFEQNKHKKNGGNKKTDISKIDDSVGCKIDDEKCRTKTSAKFNSCYVSMAEAYSNKKK